MADDYVGVCEACKKTGRSLFYDRRSSCVLCKKCQAIITPEFIAQKQRETLEFKERQIKQAADLRNRPAEKPKFANIPPYNFRPNSNPHFNFNFSAPRSSSIS